MSRTMRVLLIALAVVAPFVALTVAAGADRWHAGLATPPFGWLTLQGVHLLTMLPLAYLLARMIRDGPASLIAPQRQSLWLLAWLLVAIAAAALTLAQATRIDDWLLKSSAGFTVRFAARLLWSLALQLPCCVLAVSQHTSDGVRRVEAIAWPRVLAVCGLAVVVPWTYARHLERAQASFATELMTRGKFAAAQIAVLGLCDLGSSQPIAEQLPGEAARELAARTAEYLATIAQPLAGDATPRERIARARLHAQFGQLEAARAEVTALAEVDLEAALLTAATWQEQENFAASTHAYRRARELAGRADVAGAIRALDGLAFNARARGRHDEAAAYYEAGLEEFPVAAAHFHFQLAQQYQLGGRPWLAAEHFESAASLDAAQFRRAADEQLAKLRLTTPACLPVGWGLRGSR